MHTTLSPTLSLILVIPLQFSVFFISPSRFLLPRPIYIRLYFWHLHRIIALITLALITLLGVKIFAPLCDLCKLQDYKRLAGQILLRNFASPFIKLRLVEIKLTASSFQLRRRRYSFIHSHFPVADQSQTADRHTIPISSKRSIGAIVKGLLFTMSVRTRRQKAAAAAVDEQPATTANGVVDTTSTSKRAEKGPQENIYLFWPNLVGIY